MLRLVKRVDLANLVAMTGEIAMRNLLAGNEPLLALAPMQDVTDLAFWRVMAPYGGPQIYFTEYFRVFATSHLDKHILKSITESPAGRPVVAQMIGNDIPSLVRTARELQNYPVAGVDLNLGCPAPVVYRKCAGGGLLRDLPKVDAILGALREVVRVPFSVKTRIGFDTDAPFPELLRIFSRHNLDLLTVHGRTVKEMYRSEVHFDRIAEAVAALPCPVLANGNVYSGQRGQEILALTGARGLMIGRGAIRNPWIFRQFEDLRAGRAIRLPTGSEVLAYVRELYAALGAPDLRESSQVQRIKKHLNYLGVGVEPTGEFLHRMRRISTATDLFSLCEDFLAHDRPLPLEPFPLDLKETDVMAGEHL
jgi:tRNA-dihydrouridine synthase